MSSIICNTNCPVDSTPPVSYWDACDGNVFRRYGFPYFAIIDKCEWPTFTDPNDLTEWAAAYAAGLIQTSPCGNIELTNTQDTSSNVNACGGDTVMRTTYDITFTTYQTDPGYADCYYFQELLRKTQTTALMFFDCAGNPYMQADWIDAIRNPVLPFEPGVSYPGLDYTISSIPTPGRGDGDSTEWSMTFQTQLPGSEMLCPVVFDDLLDTITG